MKSLKNIATIIDTKSILTNNQQTSLKGGDNKTVGSIFEHIKADCTGGGEPMDKRKPRPAL